jgi:diguanylate cyclase (GGDEF)-like protein/PAS domain S-box-containing protein
MDQAVHVPGERRARTNFRREEDRILAEQADLFRFYQTVMDSANAGIIALSPNATVLSWNRGAEHIFGYAENDVKGVAAPEPLSFTNTWWNGEVSHWEGTCRHRDGRTIEVSIESSPMLGPEHTPFGYVWIVRDIGSQLQEARAREEREQRLQEEALTDALTGTANRRRLDQTIQAEVSRVSRHGGSLSLVVIDLDDLKSINDQHGHVVGDKALWTFARVIQSQLRVTDLLARFGGDEFVVVMPNTVSAEAAVCVERIRTALVQTPVPDLPRKLTASFGIAEHKAEEAGQLTLQKADQALYLAKKGGRDRAVHWPGSE